MIFANVQNLVIPKGEVAKITHGTTVLWERPGLPSIYQEVEYLQGENNKATYIDLGFAFDTKARILIDLESLSNITSYTFGAAENSGALRCLMTTPANSGISMYGSTGTALIVCVSTITYNEKLSFEIVLAQGGLSVTNLDTGEVKKNTSQGAYTMTNNLYLFAQNYNGTPRCGNTRRIYKFQYYDQNDELICDLVPCYRKSDGVCGMYDRARKIFLTNIGSGADFTKGADV